MNIWFPLAGAVSFLLPSVVLAAPLAYPELVSHLYDLEALSALPLPGERCAQWSSYDRTSRYDEAAGRYVAWDANGDGRGVIRRDGGAQVLAEMTGPGCIWRIWSAAPGPGHVRIFLDGAVEPAVDLPFAGYFDRRNEPFTRPALVHVSARGCNNYTPIPYARSCRIVADENWGNYYQFVYSTFPPDTTLSTFRRSLAPDDTAALDRAQTVLANCGGDPAGPRTGQKTVQREVRIGPGTTVEVLSLSGPRAITSLRAQIVGLPPWPESADPLRELTLSIHWDGERAPAVWAPFGDFFGTAPGENPYRSLPLGLTRAGVWYSHWYMPFARRASLRIANDGPLPRRVTFDITHAPLIRPVAQLARFHAKWHRDAFPPVEPERQIDWTMLRTEGRGRWVGVMLHVWNPRGSWWGEGDEKFFVDGEKFPSTIGTGSEDYFGYAWCDPTLFTHAFHNQTISMQNRGHVSVNRWHIADQVPFEKSFQGCIEKYFPNRRPTLYAATAYWYLAPGGVDPYEPVALAERTGYWTNAVPSAVKGALEGENLVQVRCTGGQSRRQEMGGFSGDWSGGTQLWWTGAKDGDRLDLPVPVGAAGRYTLTAQLTRARDYGIVQLSFDGLNQGAPIDLYSPEVVPTGPLDLGRHELTAGSHTLTVTLIGANPKALPSRMFGLDYLKLEPAP